MKSTDATPSAVATSTAATPDAASDQRRRRFPELRGRQRLRDQASLPQTSRPPERRRRAPSETPSPTPVPCRASVAAPAPAPKFPGVRGSRPASAIAASRTTATQMGCGTPSAIAIATAAAIRATHEQADQPKRATPSRGERAIERKIWSRLPILPAVLALSACRCRERRATPSDEQRRRPDRDSPTAAAGTISAARTSVRAAATEAATPPVRQSRSFPGSVRESSPSRTAPPRCAGAIELTSEPIA